MQSPHEVDGDAVPGRLDDRRVELVVGVEIGDDVGVLGGDDLQVEQPMELGMSVSMSPSRIARCAAADSMASRISRTSSASLGAIGRTIAPLRESRSSSPSAVSRKNASWTGVRLIPRSATTSPSLIIVPDAKSPRMIAAFTWWKARSDAETAGWSSGVRMDMGRR